MNSLRLSPIIESLMRRSGVQRSMAMKTISSLDHRCLSVTKEHVVTQTYPRHHAVHCNNIIPITPQNKRLFSFYGNNNSNSQSRLGGPSYQVYGENTAFTIRAIPPEFRQLASGTIVTSNASNGRGRLLLQWTPRDSNGKYQWDHSIRFALAAEEAASVFLARLDPQKLLLAQQNDIVMPDTVSMTEIVRRPNNNSPEGGGFFENDMPEKVFRAQLQGDGTVQLTVDYERDGVGGQAPPSPTEAPGPLHIDLMVGEFHVVRSIIQYSIPKLIGWSPMLDAFVDQAVEKSTQNSNQSYGGRSPHNYQSNDDGGVPF